MFRHALAAAVIGLALPGPATHAQDAPALFRRGLSPEELAERTARAMRALAERRQAAETLFARRRAALAEQAARDPLSAYLNDFTLAPGDVVQTPTGPRVFWPRGDAARSTNDFLTRRQWEALLSTTGKSRRTGKRP
jgi:hypothetical protein